MSKLMQDLNGALDRIKQLEKKVIELDRSETQLILERDYWEEKATELANDVGKALGFDVGEHSNLNCPVQNAIDGLREMSSEIAEWRL